MVVGKNIAVFGNDEARADSTRNRTLLLLAGRRSIALTRAGCAGRHEIRAEEPAEHIVGIVRSEEHTSELQSLMRISYAVFCLKKKNKNKNENNTKQLKIK